MEYTQKDSSVLENDKITAVYSFGKNTLNEWIRSSVTEYNNDGEKLDNVLVKTWYAGKFIPAYRITFYYTTYPGLFINQKNHAPRGKNLKAGLSYLKGAPNLELILNNPANVSISICDNAGKIIKKVTSGKFFTHGLHTIRLHIPPSGRYICRVITNSESVFLPFNNVR